MNVSDHGPSASALKLKTRMHGALNNLHKLYSDGGSKHDHRCEK